MQHSESLNLKELIRDNTEFVDNTDGIRRLKHSVLIRDGIREIETMKTVHADVCASDKEAFLELCRTKSSFLFNHYTDIFNKVCNDEIDLGIMTQLLTIMKLIEDEKVDQTQGSVMVGKILKELYVDSALKRAEKLDQRSASENPPKVEGIPVSWSEWKQMRR